MALVKRQTANSKTVIIAVVILVVGGLGYFLFQKFYLSAGPAANTNTGQPGGSVITSFGEEILNDSRFTQLKQRTVQTSVDVNKDSGQPQPFQ